MIYLVEDDNNIRKLISYALTSQGFEVRDFPAPSMFWPALEKQLPQLVILDLMLPGEDGLSILKKLRARHDTARVPVIILTARDSEFDKVTGLDLGADDYIAKPFGMMELISRVKAVLRRAQEVPQAPSWRIGALYVCPQKHIVRVGDADIALTLKEFELLCALLEADGMVLTRDTLLNSIWGYAFDGENRTVDVHIRKLRQKLGDAGACIETVKGIGYKIGGRTHE
jgi:two-component system alkaline phosphatase synthesis response regulator PhoP